MRFITLFSGALVATTAVNILLASDAHAGFPPNGWEQVGKSCAQWYPGTTNNFYKLRKKSDKSIYGVYRNKKNWKKKGLTLVEANREMNRNCNRLPDDKEYKPN